MPAVYHPSHVGGYAIETASHHDRKQPRPRTAVPVTRTDQLSAAHLTSADDDDDEDINTDGGGGQPLSQSRDGGDYRRRRPTSAMTRRQLMRSGSGQLLQQQVLMRQSQPFDVDEDGLPRLRFGRSYGEQWTGVLDIDNCFVPDQYSSRLRADIGLRDGDNTAGARFDTATSNIRSKSEPDFDELARPTRRTICRHTNSVGWRHQDVATRNNHQQASLAETFEGYLGQHEAVRHGRQRPVSSSSLGAMRSRQTWTSAGDIKLLLKRPVSQRRRPNSVHDIRCACALNKATPTFECHGEDNVSVQYVDCRHARCFDLSDDYDDLSRVVDLELSSATLDPASKCRQRRAESANGNSPPCRSTAQRPSTAPLSRSYGRPVTPSSSPPAKRSSLLASNYFDFVVGLKLHEWGSRSIDIANQRLRATSAGELATGRHSRRCGPTLASVSGRQAPSRFLLDPSRIEEGLEDVEYVDAEDTTSFPVRLQTVAVPMESSRPDGFESSANKKAASDDEKKRQTHVDVGVIMNGHNIAEDQASTSDMDPSCQLTRQSEDIVKRWIRGELNDESDLRNDIPVPPRHQDYGHPRQQTRPRHIAVNIPRASISSFDNEHVLITSRSRNDPATLATNGGHVGLQELGIHVTTSRSTSPPLSHRPRVNTLVAIRPSTATRKGSRNRKSRSASRRRSKMSPAKREGHRASSLADVEKFEIGDVIVDETEMPTAMTSRVIRPLKERKPREQRRLRAGVTATDIDDNDRTSAMGRHKEKSKLRTTRNLSSFLDIFGYGSSPSRRYSVSDSSGLPSRQSFRRRPSLFVDTLIDSRRGSPTTAGQTSSKDVNGDFVDDIFSELWIVDPDLFQDDDRFEGVGHRVYAGSVPSSPKSETPPEAVPEPAVELDSPVIKLPRQPPAKPIQPKYNKTLWDSLQSDFEKHFRRGGDLKDILAAVVGDNTELQDFRDTLLKMAAFQYPEETPVDRDSKTKKVDASQKPKLQPWQLGRLALSERACRLEIPMDVRQLEKMTPQDYMQKYCRIAVRRKALYKKIFSRYQEKGSTIPLKDLHKALTDIYSSAIQDSDVVEVCTLMEIDEETKIDLGLFCSVAAIAERLLYPRFVTDHTKDIQEYKQEKIESADFYSMLWKLDGVKVNPPMRALFDCLTAHQVAANGAH